MAWGGELARNTYVHSCIRTFLTLLVNTIKAKPQALPKSYSPELQKLLDSILCFDPAKHLSAAEWLCHFSP
jgi:hypothetical protein